jgi:hypothetical protein
MSGLRDPLYTEAVEGLDPDEPVVMLNLVKFRARSLDGDGSGWDAYLRYSAHTSPLLKQRGATILWAGTVGALALGRIRVATGTTRCWSGTRLRARSSR